MEQEKGEEGQGSSGARLTCIALGSRGDAEPLLVVLSRTLANSERAVQATFACRPSVWAELKDATHGRRGLDDSIEAGIKHAPIRECSVCMAIALAARRKGMDPQAVEGTGGISAEAADSFLRGERADMLMASRGASIVMCNLFCLEGFHIAEAIGAECVVLSPCLPQCMPAGFEEQFAEALPTLYGRLVAEQKRQQQTARQLAYQPSCTLADADADARCSWDDIVLWMWRLFLDDHGDWRREALGLEPSPLDAWDDPAYTDALPRRTVILFGVSPSLAALVLDQRYSLAEGRALADAQATGGDSRAGLEKAYAVESLAVAVNPAAGLCCGPWRRLSEASSRALLPGCARASTSPGANLPEDLKAFVLNPDGKGGIACVCFGSMPGLGLMRSACGTSDHLEGDCGHENPAGVGCLPTHCSRDVGLYAGGAAKWPPKSQGVRALELLMHAMQQHGLRGVWLLKGWPPDAGLRLGRFAQILGRKPHDDFMTLDSVPHEELLPCCSVTVHHGGAGTVATCLIAGCSQIICPIAFDQHTWASVLSEKGLAVVVPLLQLAQRQHDDTAASRATAPSCGGARLEGEGRWVGVGRGRGGGGGAGLHGACRQQDRCAGARGTRSSGSTPHACPTHAHSTALEICEAFQLVKSRSCKRCCGGSVALRVVGGEGGAGGDIHARDSGVRGKATRGCKRSREAAIGEERDDVAGGHAAQCANGGLETNQRPSPVTGEGRGVGEAEPCVWQGLLEREACEGTAFAARVVEGLLRTKGKS